MRKYLFEFEDLLWFPDAIRRSMVDYLSFFLRKTDFYKPITPLLAECLECSDTKQIVDLCSGGGGPMLEVQKNLYARTGIRVPMILTDKFPNIAAFRQFEKRSSGHIKFEATSVDATQVPEHIKGIRTSFSAFHHFEPEKAKKILKDAVRKNEPIAIFDGGDKHMLAALGMIILHPVVFLFCTPFFRPFRFSRIFFTYLVPIIPVCTIWDGIISIARLYRPHQMDKLIEEADNGMYIWKTGLKRHKLGFSIAYLVGYPKNSERK